MSDKRYQVLQNEGSIGGSLDTDDLQLANTLMKVLAKVDETQSEWLIYDKTKGAIIASSFDEEVG